MESYNPSSDVERNFLIALERTAAYHYKLTLLRKTFRALDTYRNTIRPIRDAYDVMTQNHVKHEKARCFSEWLQLTRDVIQTRHNNQLADQFHSSVLAARAIDTWKRFTQNQILERQQLVCPYSSLFFSGLELTLFL